MNEAHIPIRFGDDTHRTYYFGNLITEDIIATFDFFNYLTSGCPIQGATRSGWGVVVTTDRGKFSIVIDYVKTILYTGKNELSVWVFLSSSHQAAKDRPGKGLTSIFSFFQTHE